MPHHEKKAKKRRSRSKESKKDKKRKRHSTSSSSSSESDSGDRFQTVLDKQRSEKRRLRKLEKERLKAKETPEEKRARRLAKKLRKQEKRKKENSSYLPPQIAYTNLNNPFNDELKRARDARLAAREDMEMMQRDADRKTHFEWTSKEAEFQLQQAKVRSRIRIEQNRAKPIDLLSRYIQYGDENAEENDERKGDEFELEEPIKYIKGLSQDDYEDLVEDIKVCEPNVTDHFHYCVISQDSQNGSTELYLLNFP
uniref:Cactin_mid domain-containing protein n=1 Tax=Angiostrongylus cantonensis TaxID=6313 RepID=A0A0K0CV59_ANGCA